MTAELINNRELQRGAAYYGDPEKESLHFPTLGKATSYMSLELQRLEKVASLDYAMLSPYEEGGYLLLLSYRPFYRYDMETIINEEGKRKRLYRFNTAEELQAMVAREYYEGATYEGSGNLLFSSGDRVKLREDEAYRIMIQKDQLGTASFSGGKWTAEMRLRRR